MSETDITPMKWDDDIAPKRREPITQWRGVIPEEWSPHDIVKRYIKAFIINSTVLADVAPCRQVKTRHHTPRYITVICDAQF
jgi:hypothetical protein